jgi:hypothetical protein
LAPNLGFDLLLGRAIPQVSRRGARATIVKQRGKRDKGPRKADRRVTDALLVGNAAGQSLFWVA